MSNYTNRKEIRNLSKSELHRVIAGLYKDLKESDVALKAADVVVKDVQAQAEKLMSAMREERHAWQKRVKELEDQINPKATLKTDPDSITDEHISEWKAGTVVLNAKELDAAAKSLGLTITHVIDENDPIKFRRKWSDML